MRATRQAVGTNTNLGIVLLCAPLIRAAEMAGGDLRENLGKVLDGLDVEDTAAVFEAIVLALARRARISRNARCQGKSLPSGSSKRCGKRPAAT